MQQNQNLILKRQEKKEEYIAVQKNLSLKLMMTMCPEAGHQTYLIFSVLVTIHTNYHLSFTGLH